MQPFAVPCTIVKPHNRQAALNQAVYRHNDQLLHLKICTEESNRRIGIRHQKEIDEGHHKRTEGVHNKRWKAKGKNAADHPLLQMKAFDFYLHLLLFPQQQGKCQEHGQRIARDSSHRSAADSHSRENTNPKNQDGIEYKIDHHARNLEPHRGNHIPGGLYHLLDGDMHHIGDLHERTYAHIGNAQLIDFFIIGECPKVGFHNQ